MYELQANQYSTLVDVNQDLDQNQNQDQDQDQDMSFGGGFGDFCKCLSYASSLPLSFLHVRSPS